MTDDICCFICRNPFGTCSTGYACDHHQEARVRLEAWRPSHKDPTGDRAVQNIMRAQRQGRRT